MVLEVAEALLLPSSASGVVGPGYRVAVAGTFFAEVTAKKDRAAGRGRDTSDVLTELPGSGSEELSLRI